MREPTRGEIHSIDVIPQYLCLLSLKMLLSKGLGLIEVWESLQDSYMHTPLWSEVLPAHIVKNPPYSRSATHALQMWLFAITGVLCKRHGCDYLSYWLVQTQVCLLCTNYWTRLGNLAIQGRLCPAEELLYFLFRVHELGICSAKSYPHIWCMTRQFVIPSAVTCDSWQFDCVWCFTTCSDFTWCDHYHHNSTCSCILLQAFHDFQF